MSKTQPDPLSWSEELIAFFRRATGTDIPSEVHGNPRIQRPPAQYGDSMAEPLKVTHFFKDQTTGLGWSETWYVNGSGLNGGRALGRIIAQSRIALLAGTNFITHQRITSGIRPTTATGKPFLQRQSILESLQLRGTATPFNGIPGDYTTTAVKVRWMSSDAKIFRTQQLRGVPDDWFAGGDQKARSTVPAWITAHLNALFQASANIRHLPPISNPPVVRTYTFTPVNQGFYTGYSERKTGRPFNLPAGRRPKRA